VSDRRALQDRYTQIAEPIHNDVCEPPFRVGVVGCVATRERSENDPGARAQIPARAQLGEHPIDPIGRLLDLFEKEDGAAAIDRMRRSDERRNQREIPARRPAARPPTMARGPSIRSVPIGSCANTARRSQAVSAAPNEENAATGP